MHSLAFDLLWLKDGSTNVVLLAWECTKQQALEDGLVYVGRENK